jgi:hypothetical protein
MAPIVAHITARHQMSVALLEPARDSLRSLVTIGESFATVDIGGSR